MNSICPIFINSSAAAHLLLYRVDVIKTSSQDIGNWIAVECMHRSQKVPIQHTYNPSQEFSWQINTLKLILLKEIILTLLKRQWDLLINCLAPNKNKWKLKVTQWFCLEQWLLLMIHFSIIEPWGSMTPSPIWGVGDKRTYRSIQPQHLSITWYMVTW